MPIKGLIFDFDGLILDTETPEVVAWINIYRKYGQKFDFDKYAPFIGTVCRMIAPAQELARLVPGLNAETVFNEWLVIEKRLIEKESILPGVREYLQESKKLDLKVAIASSSEKPWVVSHLERLGIHQFFDFIHTVDETKIPKPNPALYLLALESLKAEPNEVIAFEDSTNGVSAAKTAGIFCVAIPNPTTKSLPLDQADLILESLAHLPLTQLLERF
mgnify:CR=1 FL=1